MKKLLVLILIGILSFLLQSCSPVNLTPKPSGDIATIKMKTGKIHEGEFLFTKENNIYLFLEKSLDDKRFSTSKIIAKANISEITSFKIEGYSNKKWILPVVLFEVIPALLLTIAASSAEANSGAVLAISSLPAIITTSLYLISTPSPPHLTEREMLYKLKEFSKYARFPQGLNDDQLDSFMKIYGITEIKTIK